MAQKAIEAIGENRFAAISTRTVPTLGMRGGLGKTLLIAFLLLAIVPLSFLAFLTYNQIQRDTRQKLITSLETIAALKKAHLADWVEGYERQLVLLTNTLDPAEAGSRASLEADLAAALAAMQATDPALTALLLLDEGTGEVLAATDLAEADLEALQPLVMADRRLVIAPAPQAGEQPGVAVSYRWDGRRLVGLLRWDALQQIITDSDRSEGGISTYLITGDGWMASAQGLTLLPQSEGGELPPDIAQALQGQSGSGSSTDLDGAPVFSAYRWSPELQVALLSKQLQTQALASGNALTAVVVGATLVVALITAAIAAVVTRRVTRPIVQLTETAAWMARGDLNQRVTITRKDEIGVLARAFNRMAAELRVLYENLEAKVAERTQQLETANQRVRYHIMQLAISAEVARVAASIREMDRLLTTVTELIGDAFELHHASIYLLDESGEQAVWRAGNNMHGPRPPREAVGGSSLVGRVADEGRTQVVRATTTPLQPPVACEMAVPLRSGHQVLGVLHLQSRRPDDFGDNDRMVYQSLADQIGIAIINARAYAVERETIAKLRELDRIQAQFLTNMSHALRTPLNSIIGFSRVMLKELDGPLTDLQRTDLTAIYHSGRQLLGLINDMLELSQLDLGAAPFSLAPVDLAEIIEGVMATARALARNKPVQLYEEAPTKLPTLYTDGQRLRQVILALLANAVKFTDEGSIRLSVSADDAADGHVIISVKDTGIGIPPPERTRIFSDEQHGEAADDGTMPGFGLAISKRVVEKLGGQIWVESAVGQGSTFTLSLPLRSQETRGSG